MTILERTGYYSGKIGGLRFLAAQAPVAAKQGLLYKVPRFLFIGPSVFRRYCEKHQLERSGERLWANPEQDLFGETRREIKKSTRLTLEPKLIQGLGRFMPLPAIVRSDVVGLEDTLPGESLLGGLFAGRFTSLPIMAPDQIETAIRRVYASLYSEKNINLYRELGIATVPTMTLVYQQLAGSFRLAKCETVSSVSIEDWFTDQMPMPERNDFGDQNKNFGPIYSGACVSENDFTGGPMLHLTRGFDHNSKQICAVRVFGREIIFDRGEIDQEILIAPNGWEVGCQRTNFTPLPGGTFSWLTRPVLALTEFLAQQSGFAGVLEFCYDTIPETENETPVPALLQWRPFYSGLTGEQDSRFQTSDIVMTIAEKWGLPDFTARIAGPTISLDAEVADYVSCVEYTPTYGMFLPAVSGPKKGYFIHAGIDYPAILSHEGLRMLFSMAQRGGFVAFVSDDSAWQTILSLTTQSDLPGASKPLHFCSGPKRELLVCRV